MNDSTKRHSLADRLILPAVIGLVAGAIGGTGAFFIISRSTSPVQEQSAIVQQKHENCSKPAPHIDPVLSQAQKKNTVVGPNPVDNPISPSVVMDQSEQMQKEAESRFAAIKATMKAVENQAANPVIPWAAPESSTEGTKTTATSDQAH